jgi:hypothetical protein
MIWLSPNLIYVTTNLFALWGHKFCIKDDDQDEEKEENSNKEGHYGLDLKPIFINTMFEYSERSLKYVV